MLQWSVFSCSMMTFTVPRSCMYLLDAGDVPDVPDAGMDRLQEEFLHTSGLVTLMLT